ncbi:hypothetical protein F4778DRAFT_784137 [Xylariomycetidae sp. FL2044]|nr:hypothetical protein F4778DRAFT_788754 [Xylariomycetidae sp. FL2044]KAH9894714.1 hypothetical protein F4778DRAFT_784137 [Xylariomycetidae sp. FL2044]
MPFDFRAYDEKCKGLTPEELQREWQHYTRLIAGASTSTAVSGLAVPLTLGVSTIGVAMAAPAIHNARKKRDIIEKHLQRHNTTHVTRKRDVLGSMAVSGTIGIATLGIGGMGADAVASAGAEHGISAVVENELAIKVVTHAALDGAGLAVEHAHTNHLKKRDAFKAFKAAGVFKVVENEKAVEAGYSVHSYNPQNFGPANSFPQDDALPLSVGYLMGRNHVHGDATTPLESFQPGVSQEIPQQFAPPVSSTGSSPHVSAHQSVPSPNIPPPSMNKSEVVVSAGQAAPPPYESTLDYRTAAKSTVSASRGYHMGETSQLTQLLSSQDPGLRNQSTSWGGSPAYFKPVSNNLYDLRAMGESINEIEVIRATETRDKYPTANIVDEPPVMVPHPSTLGTREKSAQEIPQLPPYTHLSELRRNPNRYSHSVERGPAGATPGTQHHDGTDVGTTPRMSHVSSPAMPSAQSTVRPGPSQVIPYFPPPPGQAQYTPSPLPFSLPSPGARIVQQNNSSQASYFSNDRFLHHNYQPPTPQVSPYQQQSASPAVVNNPQPTTSTAYHNPPPAPNLPLTPISPPYSSPQTYMQRESSSYHPVAMDVQYADGYFAHCRPPPR